MTTTAKRRILEQLAAGSITIDQAETLLFEATNKHFRMTDRGAIAVLGIQRRPLVLFPKQWRQLNNRMPQLMKYIQETNNGSSRQINSPQTEDNPTLYAEQCIGEFVPNSDCHGC